MANRIATVDHARHDLRRFVERFRGANKKPPGRQFRSYGPIPAVASAGNEEKS